MGGLLLVLAWLSAAAAAASAQTPARTLEAQWKEAVDAHQSGQLESALLKYEEVLRAKPDFVPALSNAGAVYSRLGRLEDAAQHYRKALEAGGNHPAIRLNLALVYYNQSKLDEAIRELQKVQPATQQSTVLLADCYLRTGENKKVIALLESQESADDRAVSYLLGTALIRDEQVSRGQRIVDRVFRDDSAEALMLLGVAQFAAQENKKAVETLERAIQKNAKLPGLYSMYGRAKLTDGSAVEAREAFLREVEHNPFDYDSNLHLGSLYRLDRDWDNAEKYLQRARQIRPDALELKYQIASLALGRGSIEEATGMLEEITRAAPKFVEGHISLATAYYRQKRKADGDRERAIVDQLNAEMQAKELRAP